MTTSEIHLELLLGKPVRDKSGQVIGHIHEIRVEQQNDEWVIQEYLIGVGGILERLSAWYISIKILNVLGAHKVDNGYRVPWDKLDLSDPNQPRVDCTLEELSQIHQELERVK